MKIIKVDDNDIKEFFGLLDIALKVHGVKVIKSAYRITTILDAAEELTPDKKVKTNARKTNRSE